MKADLHANRYIQFVTFSCYKRRRLLAPDRAKRIVLGCMGAELRKAGGWCSAFVVMPEHVHVLLWFEQKGLLGTFLKAWKRRSSIEIKELRPVFHRYFSSVPPGDPVWQPNSYVFPIYSQRKLREKINYIHANPGRAGLTECPEDWEFSSAKWFAGKGSALAPMRIPAPL